MATAPYHLGAPSAVEDRMEALRGRLLRDAQACQQARERWTDWRAHVRAHPWLVCGAAAALGYAIVPPRRHTLSGSAAQDIAHPVPPAVRSSSGLFSRLMRAVAHRAAQQALGLGAAWALGQLRAASMARHGDHDQPSAIGASRTSPAEQVHD